MTTTTTITERPPGAFTKRYLSLSAGLIALSTLVAFEYLAVATAMPIVARELDGMALYGLAFSGSMAASVFATVLGGRWSDLRGPVAPLWTGIAGFVAGLLVAGFAQNITIFLAGRILQGLGAGLFLVTMYVLVARVYPSVLHPQVFSALAAAWVIPSMVGPVLTGVITDYVGWRWVFLGVAVLTIPASYVLARGLVGQPIVGGQATGSAGLGRRLVWATVTAAGAALMQYGSGRANGLVLMLVGAGLLAVALPQLLPKGTLVALRGLPAVVALRGVVAAAFVAAEVLVPLMLIEDRGLSPSLAGLALTGSALAWSFASWLQGRGWVKRPFALRGGAAFVTAGIVLIALVAQDILPIAAAFVVWIVAGFGMGMLYPTLSVLTLELSAEGEQGQNSSSLQVGESIFTVVVVAITGALFTAVGSGYLVSFAVAALFGVVGILIARRSYA